VLDLTATRRLGLRAASGAGLGFALLLRASGPAQTTAAATRWRVAARGSRPIGGFAPGLGRPAFRLDLEKNRDGRLGRFDIEWNPHDRRFSALPPDPGLVAAPAADRPPASAGGGRVLAFERGGA
jgi:protein ImuA